MDIFDMQRAVSDSRMILDRSRSMTYTMLELCAPNLRSIENNYRRNILARIKKELKHFNARTLEWDTEK